ncbi:Chaperone protein DnaJ [Symbiodinium microadriaticum]|uniref:Chaperone protein DnaJ n=1 Tax=Symbiodinium microadriaticum TaxID=2951 RepID=A0A1Q9BXR4_SYMMI|nr:Chaperone protein DnaJ [Symbiodinium microadriaticum]CAE7198973.1 dnaJ [Symbiodinium microadriaticum]CAE7238006.1 dnaJ [Symbiodinium sp. KB8]
MRVSICPMVEQALLARRRSGRKFATSPREKLGVSWNCSEEEVRKAFRQRAKAVHPDMQPPGSDSEVAAKKFRELQDAYAEVLQEMRGIARRPDRRQRHEGPEPAYKSKDWDAARRQPPASNQGPSGVSIASFLACTAAIMYSMFGPAEEALDREEKQNFAAKRVRLRQEQAEREQRELKQQLERRAGRPTA